MSGVCADPIARCCAGPFEEAVDVGADVVLRLAGPVVFANVSLQVLQSNLVQLFPFDVVAKACERAPELRDGALADTGGPLVLVEVLEHIADGVVAVRGAVVIEEEIDGEAEGVIVAKAFEGVLRLGDLTIAQRGDSGAVLVVERENIVVLLLLVEGLGMGSEILRMRSPLTVPATRQE